MPAVVGNPPAILSPGRGPNGPGPIDMRHAIADVGTGTVPYGPTNGYATPNGVTGFIGPAAGSLRKPIAWYVRTGGSNTNGGTSTALTPERTGTDGMGHSNTTFSAASGNFTNADVGKGIWIVSLAAPYLIISVTNSTTIVCDRAVSTAASGISWNLGGAWADPTNALKFTNPIASGDSVYIGAGTYRATYTMPNNQAFNGIVNVVGDVTGQFTGDAGMVQLTAYTTNDKTAPSGTTLLNLNGKSNLAFSNVMFVGGNATLLTATTLTSQNISFVDCPFFQGFNATIALGSLTCGYGVPFNWLFDRCLFMGVNGNMMTITLTTGNGLGDYDANILFRNSLINWSQVKLTVTNGGSLTFNGGGVRLRNVTVLGTGSVMTTVASRISTIFPCSAYNSLLTSASSTTLQAGTAGQIIEDYNLIVSSSPRSNVTAGAHSISDGSYAPLFHFGQERIWLPPLFRPFGEPMAGSPLLGFGNDGGQTPYDLRGPFNIRPAGGASALPAVGALERADTFVADPTPIGNDTTPVKLTGPGYNDFLLPIGLSEINRARTVSIQVQWDANYSSPLGGLPALQIEAKPQMGVSQQIAVATGGSGTPHTLTLSLTPTAAGVLNIRALSFDASGTSVVEFDSLTVT